MKSALVAALLLAAGCRSNVVSELLVDVVTDLPSVQLDRVVLTVSRGGNAIEQHQWMVTPKDASRLPGTLGLYTSDGRTPEIEVSVAGYFQDTQLVERRARVQPVSGERRLLRMALDSACRARACADGQTCIDGACVDATVSPSTLPGFEQAGKIVCGSPGYLDTTNGQLLPVSEGGCAKGQSCVEGLCRGPQEGTVVGPVIKGNNGPKLGTLAPGAVVLD